LRSWIEGHPSDIPPWPRQTGDQPAPDGIEGTHEDNGDRGGSVLGSLYAGLVRSKDQIHRQADELGGKVGEPVEVALRIAALKGDVLSLHIAEIAQPVDEGIKEGRRPRSRGCALREQTDPRALCGCLRHSGARRREEGEGEDEPEDAAPHGGVL